MLLIVKKWAFPLTLLFIFSASALAINQGADASMVVTMAGLAGLFMATLIQHLIPNRHTIAEPGERRADVIFFLLTVAMDALIVAGLNTIGPVHTPLTDIPLFLAVILAVVIWELVSYWAHWMGHHIEWLWRMHAVHHAPRRMTVLNNFRVHPLDLLLKSSALAVVIVLGFSPITIAMMSVIRSVVVAFQHADADLEHGRLNYIFSTNTLHQWHHSADPTQAHSNYGTILSVWDWIFGTAYLPSEPQAPTEMGLFDQPAYPTHRIMRMLVAPICWARCTAASYRGCCL